MLLLFSEKHLVSLTSKCPLGGYSLLNTSVAGAGGAECPACHISPRYNTTPRPHPALCPGHTIYPVLCSAALAHEGWSRRYCNWECSKYPNLCWRASCRFQPLSYHIPSTSPSYMTLGGSHMLGEKKIATADKLDLHYRMHL